MWVGSVQKRWKMDTGSWLFLVVIATFYLILDFTVMLGSATWTEVNISFLVNDLIQIYCMPMGVKNVFGTAKYTDRF